MSIRKHPSPAMAVRRTLEPRPAAPWWSTFETNRRLWLGALLVLLTLAGLVLGDVYETYHFGSSL